MLHHGPSCAAVEGRDDCSACGSCTMARDQGVEKGVAHRCCCSWKGFACWHCIAVQWWREVFTHWGCFGQAEGEFAHQCCQAVVRSGGSRRLGHMSQFDQAHSSKTLWSADINSSFDAAQVTRSLQIELMAGVQSLRTLYSPQTDHNCFWQQFASVLVCVPRMPGGAVSMYTPVLCSQACETMYQLPVCDQVRRMQPTNEKQFSFRSPWGHQFSSALLCEQLEE